jgi:hypothetical protein
MLVSAEHELTGAEAVRYEVTDRGRTSCMLLPHSSRFSTLACLGAMIPSSKFALRKRLPPRFGSDADGHFP